MTNLKNYLDSPQQAHRDTKIQNFHYKDSEFRKFFTTPFDQYKQYVGKPFEVVMKTNDVKFEPDDEDTYIIRFEDGEEINAFGHEVCQLDYEKCTPLVMNHATGDLSDHVYHSCLDAWDNVKKGLNEEDAAGVLIDVVERLRIFLEREEERACQRNAKKVKSKDIVEAAMLQAGINPNE